MSANEDLQRFVRDGLAVGRSRAELETVLGKAGWDRPQVGSALAGFADLEFPVPVPRPKPSLSARDAFLYLLLFTTLYISAFSFGGLIFHLINQAYPDPLLPPRAIDQAARDLRWSIASLVVAFPVFAGVSWQIGRDVSASPSHRVSPIRRWLTYMTLFVAAAVLIGDVTALVHSVLAGELTARFVLKVLTVGAIAGTAFWYYLTDLRVDERGVEA